MTSAPTVDADFLGFDASTLLNNSNEGEGHGYIPYIKALQRWRLWCRHGVPLFYSTCVQTRITDPSQTVQLYPYVWREPLSPGLLRHAVLYGTVDPDGAGAIELSCYAVDEPWAHDQLNRGSLARADAEWAVCSLSHPAGDVDRLRYCPDRPELVAAKCSGAALSLYDIGPALKLMEELRQEAQRAAREASNRSEDADLMEDEDDGVSTASRSRRGGDRQGDAGDAGVSPREGRPRGEAGTSTAARTATDEAERQGPCSVLQSDRQDGVSLAWGHSGGGGAGGGNGGASTHLRLFSGLLNGAIGEYAIREDGSLAEVTVRRGGHDGDADVTELAWSAAGPPGGPTAAAAAATDRDGGAEAGPSGSAAPVAPLSLLASSGTDGRTLLWDPRQRQPALRVPRCRQDVNGVAFAPLAAGSSSSSGGSSNGGGGGGEGTLLATAGDEGIVRVYDVRHLSSSSSTTAAASAGVPAPAPALHRLKGHMCGVRQLAFSPHSRALLASADEQGRVILWELGRKEPLQEGLASRPELVFVHAGHVLPVDDFGWSTELYGTVASVSGFLDPEVVEAARAEAVRADSGGAQELEGQPPAVQVWRPAEGLLPCPGGAARRPRLRD